MILSAGGWEFGWEALVAIGTLALAFVTLALALSTRALARGTSREVEHTGKLVLQAQEQVAIAREQTRIAQMTLGAQIRPVLIDAPLDLDTEETVVYPGRSEPITLPAGGVHVFGDDDRVMISLPVRNAGVGLAMVRGVSLLVGEPIPSLTTEIRPANVAPGERSRINFSALRGEDAFPSMLQAVRSGNFSVELGYSDLAGGQSTLSRFDVYSPPAAHTNWEVRQVHFREPGTLEPFAGSAPVG